MAPKGKSFIHVCPRCDGRGRYDRGYCYGCHKFGSNGWVLRSRKGKIKVQVTAIRNEAEGRIDWCQIWNAEPQVAVEIVRRQMRARNRPETLIKSVQAERAQ